MLNVLSLLKDRYQQVCSSKAIDPERRNRLENSLLSVSLAEAALRKRKLLQEFPDLPRHLVVVGPTQVGKSTVVNQFLDHDVADVSALAGHTVHCRGFIASDSACVDQGDSAPDWAKRYFTGMVHRPMGHLDRSVGAEYSLTRISANPDLRGTVVWDTPDFDSLAAARYLDSVVRAIALADQLIVVVSRDKYADQSVWQMLDLINRLGVPRFVVFNKTPAESRRALHQSFAEKTNRLLGSAEPDIHFLPEFDDIKQLASAPEFDPIRAQAAAAARADNNDQWMAFTRHFWPDWIREPEAEHAALEDWRRLARAGREKLDSGYQQQYLSHSRHEEILQMALAELLVLLEIPGVARPLTKLRGYVTWPMRKLLGAAGVESRINAGDNETSQERLLLDQVFEHGMTHVASELAIPEHWDSGYQQMLQQRLGEARPQIKQTFDAAVDDYQIALKQKIEEAARALYKQLAHQPATLNSLRAARVTADAAGVVLAVKAGGLGLADLVIAPAMLSVTSMLTEGALGQYLQRVQRELEQYQQTEVKKISEQYFLQPLQQLAAINGQDDVFAVEPELLKRAKQMLDKGDV